MVRVVPLNAASIRSVPHVESAFILPFCAQSLTLEQYESLLLVAASSRSRKVRTNRQAPELALS